MENISLSDSLHIRNLKKEYLLKKDRINRRLKEFDKFYNGPYSWFYEDNRMELRQVDKNNDERLFEELCFCIFTANTSAEMGMKAIDAIRDISINGTAEEMTKKLEGIYRFNVLRPSYILHTREYLKKELNFKLKEKIESLKDNTKELRDFFAFNPGIKGLGYKEASHFLRNIGFKGYAILDKHILNSLIEFNVIDKIKMPVSAKQYPEIEKKMKFFSNEIGIPMDELDLLLWSRKNGKILK
ncbi:MAG: N-glycosylase/DNA lyase [Candidatus Woesearchaeota archaeon]|jgi:N-glycosylase/DNA lyase|nr:N-glycosylase/DNA lyase [Candidatus Woesearchaeota archaeon]|tara:strand:- start:11366 stop:12091 length:726 start_codon:yes stop_codon:yes gene_type:complete